MSQEHHNVILFGAGVSFEAGIPLLDKFVDKMWEYAIRGKVGDKAIAEADRNILIEANKIREALEPYNSRAFFDNRNLEDILSLLSFEALSGGEHVTKYNTLVKAVARTIELSCKCQYQSAIENPTSFGNDNYHNFWDSMLSAKVREASPALITFNYDLVLERKLWERFHYMEGRGNPLPVASCGINYHFGIYDFSISTTPQRFFIPSLGAREGQRSEFRWYQGAEVEIPYLKLHGSLNWNRDWSNSNPDAKSQQVRPGLFPTMVVDDPLILPPVFNKMNSSAINGVWSTALELIRKAKNIIIVGYSLPRTDIYMQYFLKAAIGPNSNLQRIIVFDPALFKGGEKSHEMKRRYLECFSPQFTDRITFDPYLEGGSDDGTFRHFVRMLSVRPQNLLFYP